MNGSRRCSGRCCTCGPRTIVERNSRGCSGCLGAGSSQHSAELKPAREPQPGDVLIQGGYPGHAVLVLDVAVAPDGRRWLLLGQSYMPAQEFHVLKNGDGVWYDAADLATERGLKTPEWPAFHVKDVRRF